MHLINDKWGVLSTGVIDPDTKLAYMVAWISPDGTPLNGTHFIYTLNASPEPWSIRPYLWPVIRTATRPTTPPCASSAAPW